MHLITFRRGARVSIGILNAPAGRLTDLSVSAPDLPGDMQDFIALGEGGLTRAAAAHAASSDGDIDLADVQLLAPVPTPRRNIMCVGKNYHEHAREFHSSGFDAAGKQAVPEHPIIFTKLPSSVIGPDVPIPSGNDDTGSVDYEGELTIVIGPGGRDIAPENALDHVYGYTIINDVTSRTQQHRFNQWFLGKSLDGFCPMGPAIVTADEVGDVSLIRLLTTVNGEIRQDAPVSDLIFDVPTLVSTISRGRTLLAGDLIATGTAAGVGIGFNPPKFLQPGDQVNITFDRIGTLRNPVT